MTNMTNVFLFRWLKFAIYNKRSANHSIHIQEEQTAKSFACTTAVTASRMPTARRRSPRSSIGFRAGVTSASILLQLKMR